MASGAYDQTLESLQKDKNKPIGLSRRSGSNWRSGPPKKALAANKHPWSPKITQLDYWHITTLTVIWVR